LAVAVGLREGLPADVQLKWPNDLWAAGRKLGGILCEAQWEGDRARIAVGFGINLHTRAWPAGLADVATTLQDATGQVHDAPAILPGLLVALEGALDDYLRGGFETIRGRYVPHCTVLGQRVQLGDASDPRAAQLVTAVDLDDDGALLVRDRPGAGLRRVEAADVWLSR
jgi:BirA family biotin operon repressor/biotin-[acetyl-CoA-carboxylase] ligase